MITRRDSLTQALGEVEARALTGASTIIVSRRWWDTLSPNEQDIYHSRAARADVELRVDEAISSHFVEIRGGDQGPPLSTEHPM
jgi:hypothetical protein